MILIFHGSYAIGDKLRDLSICENEKGPVKGFLISKEQSEKNIKISKNIRICNNILEAAYLIKNEERMGAK